MYAVFYGSEKVFDGTYADCREYVRLVSASNATTWWIGEFTGGGWMLVE